MEAFSVGIEQARRVLTTLNKLNSVIASFNDSLGGYRPLQLCVNRLVEVVDCDSMY